jgi:hypothetical protein
LTAIIEQKDGANVVAFARSWRLVSRIPLGDLDPKAKDWIARASDEYLRRHGRFRDLVLRMLAPDEEIALEANGVWQTRVVRTKRRAAPTRADLSAAYDESPDPLPAPIVDYIVTHDVKGLPARRATSADALDVEGGHDHRLLSASARQSCDAQTRRYHRRARDPRKGPHREEVRLQHAHDREHHRLTSPLKTPRK